MRLLQIESRNVIFCNDVENNLEEKKNVLKEDYKKENRYLFSLHLDVNMCFLIV